MITTTAAKISVICGSRHPESNLLELIRIVLDTLKKTSAEVQQINLHELDLPVMNQGDQAQAILPAVESIKANANWAEGFLLVTPEYHGNMSGSLKNWFDFLYHELAGKFAGVIACTGGGSGEMSLVAVRNCFNWCHGFTLPYHVAARANDFQQGRLVTNEVKNRIQRVVYDVVRYAPRIYQLFTQSQQLGSGVETGIAGLHPPKE